MMTTERVMWRWYGWVLLSALVVMLSACASMEVTKTAVTRQGVNVKGDITFQSGSGQLNQASKAILGEVAQALKESPDIGLIRVEGHTDDVGSDEGNLNLSKQRARSVRQYLLSQGIPKESLASEGYGESRPTRFGTSSDARAANRRVSFRLVRPFTLAGSFGLGVAIPQGDDSHNMSPGVSFFVGPSATYSIMDFLSVQAELLYAYANVDSAILHRLEIPILARVDLWEMYEVIPRASLGMSVGFNLDASLPTTTAYASVVLNLGVAIPTDWGSVDVDLRFKQDVTTLLSNGDLLLSELYLVASYVY
jgi:hypothetical protein